ncbi:MAG: tRNA (guanosine(46)-N7)-methyltransferase TrmB [Ilumatobacteraceae bacterium]
MPSTGRREHHDPPVDHRILTFKPRRRQLTPARRALFERLSPSLCVEAEGDPFNPVEEFGRDAALVLDIGIGYGDSLTSAAAADPAVDLIGADVHTPGIASTLARIEAMELSNVRLLHGDALRFVDRLPLGSLSGVRIYFPDPWHKARHRHRRIASVANISLFTELLAPSGTLHVATDIEEYARRVERLCGDQPGLVGGVVERPEWRPETRYERKGLDAGRTAIDLLYRRVPTRPPG